MNYVLAHIKKAFMWLRGHTSRRFKQAILLLFAVGVWLPSLLSVTADIVTISATLPDLIDEVPQSAAVGGAEYAVFGGEWTDYNHETVCDGNIVVLKSDSTTAMLDYDEKIPLGSKVYFTMIPLGDDATNIGYGRRTLYEFMFGDGDRESISLKYDLDGDGFIEPIGLRRVGSEVSEFTYKAYLNKPLQYSQEVEVSVLEDVIGHSSIRLIVTVDGIAYESEVLPLVNATSYNRVYLALVDFSEDAKNQTAVEFPELRICR